MCLTNHLFIEQLRGEAPKVEYSINGRQYNLPYYLVDGIYPEWPVFVKSIREPQIDKHKLFAQKQEGERKEVDVPLAFCSLALVFCDDQHVSMSKGILRVSCWLV
jgi:hypothetical protein